MAVRRCCTTETVIGSGAAVSLSLSGLADTISGLLVDRLRQSKPLPSLPTTWPRLLASPPARSELDLRFHRFRDACRCRLSGAFDVGVERGIAERGDQLLHLAVRVGSKHCHQHLAALRDRRHAGIPENIEESDLRRLRRVV